MLVGEKMAGLVWGGEYKCTHTGSQGQSLYIAVSSYLPFVPFDPFPSTLFIVSFTLLRPGAETKEGGDVDERGTGTTTVNWTLFSPLQPH